MPGLFRPEAAVEARTRVDGRVFVARPVGGAALCGLLVASVIVGAIYLANTDYDRHETVPGRLEPANGVVWIRPREAGRLAVLDVGVGDDVRAGDVLARVDIDRRHPDGRMMAPAVRAAIEDELHDLEAGIAAESSRRDAGRRAIEAELRGARTALARTQERAALTQERLALAERRRAAVASLVEQGHVSRREYETVVEQGLALREQVAVVAEERAVRAGRIRQLEAQRLHAAFESETRHHTFRREESAIRQRLLNAEAGRQLVVDAPLSGRVSAVLADPGDAVDPATPLIALYPADDELVARLYASPRAIGFVTPGEDVRLMLDAYPYQRFGTIPGVVRGVAETTVAPAHLHAGVNLQEAVYPLTVEIAATNRPAAFHLRPGMTLHADLVLERYSLLEWWLAPLRSLGERL